ncbi:MAG TPA: hypothetical protein VHT49_02825 [Acidimicrobiales bacterium]|nr:hypothetical protein [Acidimicrobiales bacterium]
MKRLVTVAAVIIGLSVTVVVGPHASSGAIGAPNRPTGYRLVASDGEVFGFGDATDHGSAGGSALQAPMVGTAVTPTGMGYWLVGADGGVFSYGDARFYGSTGSISLNQPIVGIAATPDGRGYWLVGADGGVFSFGDATFHGSAGALHLNQPIVGIAATPDGGGYWLVASDGGVFSFGDAPFHGSAGALHLNQPIVGISATSDGGGYWLVAADGGVFNYGDASFAGSTASQSIHAPIVGMSSNPQLLGGTPGGESPEISITFKNNTQSVSTFVIYQPDPSGVPGGQPLAWLTVTLWPGNQHTLTWSTAYSLSWATTGVLGPGLIYQPEEQWGLGSLTNSVLFDFRGSFSFASGPSEPPGSFWVTETANIPKDVASVALGMNSEPVVAIQATPGQVAQITPHPAYWVTAGQIPRSQVLDLGHLTNSAPVPFPSGVTAMQATLSAGDVWSVSPAPS